MQCFANYRVNSSLVMSILNMDQRVLHLVYSENNQRLLETKLSWNTLLHDNRKSSYFL